ncbi:sel1 repeat family protein [Ochrobactrum grignonense]|nr:sel1 repeat family protein [Brucella grignonensis]
MPRGHEGRPLYWPDRPRKGDTQTAAQWFRHSAELGDITSQYYLGQAYETGTGAPQDYVAAMAWYQKSAARGTPSPLTEWSARQACTSVVWVCRRIRSGHWHFTDRRLIWGMRRPKRR